MSQARPRAAAQLRNEATSAEEEEEREDAKPYGQGINLPEGFGITVFCLLGLAVVTAIIVCMALGLLASPIGVPLLAMIAAIGWQILWCWTGCQI